MRICRAPNCENPSRKHNTLCGAHHSRWYRYQSFDLPIKKRICKIHGELTPDQVSKYRNCKQCNYIAQKKWAKNNPDKIKKGQQNLRRKRLDNPSIMQRFNLRRKYGLTLEQYNEMSEKQKGLCAMCDKPEIALNRYGRLRQLAVDHCHVTGKVRELLCHSCNTGLGSYKESIAIHESGIRYLKKHQ